MRSLMHMKYLKHWWAGKHQMTLVFSREVVLSSPSTHWTQGFLTSFCVPLAGLTPSALRALCLPPHWEDSIVTVPSSQTCSSWTCRDGLSWWLWLPRLTQGLIFLYLLASLKGELAAERGKEEGSEPMWPETLAVAMAVGSPLVSLAVQGWEK